MDNPETLTTLGTRDTGRRQIKQKQKQKTQKAKKDEENRPYQKPV